MPRKNQKRKNPNSQSGRRKAKPIKFNPSDIESEQRQVCAPVIENDDALDDDQPQEQQQQYQKHQDHDHDREIMESIDGSAPIREDNDEDDDDDEDDSGNNQIILNSTLEGNEIDRTSTNQMDKTDDVQNDATAITIPVAYTESFANNIVDNDNDDDDDESMAMSQVESHELGTTNPNTDTNSVETIAMSFDHESNSNAENKVDSDDRSLIITTTSTTTTIPESTNAYVVDNDINRNSSSNSNSSDSGRSGNSIDASCDIIASVPTTDALHFLNQCDVDAAAAATVTDTVAPFENSTLTLDNLADAKIQITAQSNYGADADHSLDLPFDNNANHVKANQKRNDVTTKSEIMNYAQINQSNVKPEDQTASIHVPLDENNPNNSANGIEIDNTQCTQQQQQQHTENSNNFMKETQSNCADNSIGEKQEQPQINQIKLADKDVNSTSAIVTHSIEENRTDSKSETNPAVHEVKSKQSYRVESPEPKTNTALNVPTPIKKCRSLGDCTDQFGIQELSDAGSSAENDNTPLVSEVESEPDVPEPNKIVKLQYPNRLISIETFPLGHQDDPSVSLCPKVEDELRNCIVQQLPQQESQESQQQSPPMAKRQKRPPLPPPPPLSNPQFLHPINNYLHAISEENSDASDIESHKSDEFSAEKVNNSKAYKADAVYPKSNFDFSRVSRHTNLIAPSTEAIREEPPCILVDTKLIDPSKVKEISQPWITSTVDEQSHAELVYLDSSSSNASLSDIESISGIEGDIEDLNSESDVRIETPTIGGNSFSAFTPIVKKSSSDILDSLKQMLGNASESFEQNSWNDNETSSVLNNKKSYLNIEINKVPNPSPIDHSHFKPINENVCSIRSLLEYIAATSTDSLVDNESIENQVASCNNNNDDDATDSRNEHLNNSIYTDSANEIQNNTIQTQQEHDQQIDTKHNQLLSPQFKIGEICSNQIFVAGSINSNNPLDSNTSNNNDDNNNKELNRQDSASSHGSSHTNSTSHSQCTAKYLASQTSPNEFGDFPENTIIKSLRQLSIERLESLPYGDIILDELAKQSQQLTDPNMPYPPPKLPRIEDLEIHSELLQRPRPPPRNYQSKIKFYSNYKLKSSPSPPPVPQRPWLGIPTIENPNVLVCLSPAQREFYQENNSAPDHLLDLHNKFVDRRGYHEYTDDEVMAINFRDSVASTKQAAQCKISNMKTKDDNRLLALIREINQLTNTSKVADDDKYGGAGTDDRAKEKETSLPTTNRSSQSPAAQQQSDHATLKMSRSTTNTTTSPIYGFNSKRFSNYFDELNRLHPIVEETPKIYTNIETSNYQSRKRIENGQIVYDYSNSSHEKSSSNAEPPSCISATETETNNRQATTTTATEAAAAAATLNKSPFDVNIDKVGEALSANQIAENRYCKFAERKNSQTDDSVQHHHHHQNRTTSEKQRYPQQDESLKKNTTESFENSTPNSRFSFKEFDFVPKIFSNFFRTNKTEPEQCGSGVITKQSSETTTVQTNTENINVTKRCEIIGGGDSSGVRNSVSPLPLRKSERYSSTQSLYDLYGEEIDPMPGSPSASVLGVRGVTHRGRISPNPIRAPRINDSPKENTTSSTSDYLQQQQYQQHQYHQHHHQHRHYDWQATKHSRNFENRQSMIDQTPITRFATQNPRRMSLPKAMADSQLAYILEKERQITNEFDKLEKDRQRLLQELEEMQVNQSFEDFHKQHKKRNSSLPTLGPLSEEELQKKRMQDEWLSKVAEREERRLQKVIKVTHGTSEIAPAYKSHTNRGLSDEFLERVKERRTKLQIPSDSDWDSGAESQPIKREQVSPNIDLKVKVIDDGREADIKQLPKHLREFAEFTNKCESSESKSQCDTNATSTMKTESKEIIHKIERCDNQDGESSHEMPVRLTMIGLCLAISLPLLCWSFNRL